MKTTVGLAFLAASMLALPALAQQSFGQMQSMQPQPMQQQNPQPMQQPMPSQGQMNGGYVQPAPAPGPNMGGAAGMPQLQMLLQAEMQDFGVPPQAQLQTTLHGPTPTSIPGGQVITTDRLLGLYQQGSLLVFDVLGSGQHLPMAQNAVGAAEAGSFSDNVQQQFGEYLQQVTQGNKGVPMVFYCQGPQCWMSYNAALRAINLGYSQVYWYRGGVEAWMQMQQLASSVAPQMQPQGGMNQPGMNQQGMMGPQPMQPQPMPAGYGNQGY